MKKTLTLQGLDLTARGVRLPFGLTLDEVVLTTGPASYTHAPSNIALESPGNAVVRVSADSIADFLNFQSPGGLRDFDVQLEEGLVKVHATARVVIEIRAAAVCRLRIHDGQELHVDLVSVDALGGAGHKIVENQLRQINPILRSRDLPVPMTMSSVDVLDGTVVLTGAVHAPDYLTTDA